MATDVKRKLRSAAPPPTLQPLTPSPPHKRPKLPRKPLPSSPPSTRPKRAARKKTPPAPAPAVWQSSPTALALFRTAFPTGSALRVPNNGTHRSLALQCGLLALRDALHHQHGNTASFSSLRAIAQDGEAAQMLRFAGQLDTDSFYRVDHVGGVLREWGERNGFPGLVLGTVMAGGGPVILDVDGAEGGRVVWIWYGWEHYEGLAGAETGSEVWLREDERFGRVVYEVNSERKVIAFMATEDEEGLMFVEVEGVWR
ncbi:hypothetical protein B0T18DRAFT_432153 [Schizothecium vesticola]|uniref:Uncharacterized protein n=1 Tax=Schizothecium vesticola TaxID=314040 RepID=A0AA40EKC0_9PEZI|nr:hypothetical protein B0T18DRAFT_432153 [Schizothecium vesticola]